MHPVRENTRPATSSLVAALTLWSAMELNAAVPGFPDPPPAGTALIDDAGLVPAEEAATLAKLSRELFAEKAAAVVFVVIASIGERGAVPSDGWTVNAYARAMFLDWAVRSAAKPRAMSDSEDGSEPSAASGDAGDSRGTASDAKRPRGDAYLPPAFASKGVLVVVAVKDRKVAVVTGAHWFERAEDARNVAGLMGSHLADGDFQAAFAGGAAAVANLVRGKHVSLPGEYVMATILVILTLVLLISIVSYLRRGNESAAWRFWVGVFSALSSALTVLLRGGVNLGATLSRKGDAGADRGRIAVGSWQDSRPVRSAGPEPGNPTE